MNPLPLGSQSNPHERAPIDWHTNGVAYGAWCRCHKCGLVFRSTISFDCYASGPCDLLRCENCQLGYTVMPDAARNEFEGKVFAKETK